MKSNLRGAKKSQLLNKIDKRMINGNRVKLMEKKIAQIRIIDVYTCNTSNGCNVMKISKRNVIS